ncbi:MAG TPA: tyrosine--tRNA ligase [Kofleriaceae bacterium]|nr:tyrosine--tRNA ligase [Kofleriaceae bacterium]
MHILDELDARGLVADVTDRDGLRDQMNAGTVPLYCGYDPSGTSLHAGSLVPTILLARLQRAGHKPIVVVGGATGMIGDPSGKSAERSFLDEATLRANVQVIERQLSPFLSFGDAPTDAVMVNNYDWLGSMGFLEFLRDVGKHLTVNYMTAKESVRARLEDRDQGISYTEFSYMLLQAYDFAHLARAYGCRLQVGGSDQWGNITAGIELHRKMGGEGSLFGLVAPLLLDSKGEKMGKTAAGTRVWLDPQLTSPYAFYQYWLNVEDADVGRFLRMFSWRTLEELATLVAEHEAAPHTRLGQKTLALDITTWVHGADAARRAIAASEVMFGGSLADLGDADLEPLLADVPSSSMPRDALAAGVPLVDLLATTELAASKGAARRLLKQGGVYINNERITDESLVVRTEHLGTETMMILRAGKKSYHIVRVS